MRAITRQPSQLERLARPTEPVIVIGVLLSTTSFGWLARLSASLIRTAGLRTYQVDISPAFAADRLTRAEAALKAPPPEVITNSATLIVFVNPHQMAYASSFLPKGILERKYAIAYCAWELEQIPASWLALIATFDEVWVPSEFVRTALRNSGVSIPCRIVPPMLVRPQGIRPDRSQFGIPPDAFVVMVAFTLRSGIARKNPVAAARAFTSAFPHNDNVRLILKTSDHDVESAEWRTFRQSIGNDHRFIFITNSLSDADMWKLVASVDVVLSTHRAEGFGMIPAQAMLCSRAVVATGWSGNLEFMDDDCAMLLPYRLVRVEDPRGTYQIDHSHWAEVDEAETAKALNRLYTDPSFRDALARRGFHKADAYFSRHNRNMLDYLQKWRSDAPELIERVIS